MEFKGTKGKWEFKEFASLKLKYRFHIFSENGQNICKIVRDDNDNKLEEKANAKLIAAAPEMFEMLKYILEEDLFFQDGKDNQRTRDIKQLLTKISQ